MDLKTKRRTFFIIVGVLFCALYGMVFFTPLLNWADKLTMEGVMPLGVPFSQFIVILSSLGMAVLVTVLFYVDTSILVKKGVGEKQKNANNERG